MLGNIQRDLAALGCVFHRIGKYIHQRPDEKVMVCRNHRRVLRAIPMQRDIIYRTQPADLFFRFLQQISNIYLL